MPQRAGRELPYGVRARRHRRGGEGGGSRARRHARVERVAERGRRPRRPARAGRRRRVTAHALKVHRAPVLARALVHHPLPQARLVPKRGADSEATRKAPRARTRRRRRPRRRSGRPRAASARRMLRSALVGKRPRGHRRAKLRRERRERRDHRAAPHPAGIVARGEILRTPRDDETTNRNVTNPCSNSGVGSPRVLTPHRAS